MGNSNSINIIPRLNGIYEVSVKDIPEYPIVYLRLCWDFYNKKYCIPELCDVKRIDKEHRKILVVGMRLPGIDGIHEQCFYSSSGLNSLESLESFFETKLKYEEDYDKSAGVWIPFSGIGYNVSDTKNPSFNPENDFKLLKIGFNCLTKSPTCLYGRFGNSDPNLMQISYCIGGKFWENNVDTINSLGYDIKKLPMLTELRKQIPCYFIYQDGTNIDCAVYLNNYIASAYGINYIPSFLQKKEKIIKLFQKTNNYFNFKDLKADFRIFNILKEKIDMNFVFRSSTYKLPEETRIMLPTFWQFYLSAINTVMKNNLDFFVSKILPLILENIPIPEKNIKEKENKIEIIDPLLRTKKQDKEIEDIKENENIIIKKEIDNLPIIRSKKQDKEIEDIKTEKVEIENHIGTINNPYENRTDAKIGDYYKKGKQIVQRKK